MNKTVNEFNESKSKTKALLEKLRNFLNLGVEAGAEIDKVLFDKINNAVATIDDGKLKIALIGGFSEGKTSIAAAWMEKLDSETMKISHSESSDMVKTYQLNDDCELIDTPGLFGFKEKLNSSSEQIEKYKDITKKYISEAHLALYVMNSTNPIKESHSDDLKWLFRDLNLLSRTVFVLSRFDEVADVEDQDDYFSNLSIKKQNIEQRLADSIALTQDESDNLAIVAVAANPFDLGTEHWLENLEQFKVLSHIDKLQQATFEKVRKNGGQLSIAIEAQRSVVRDVICKELPVAVENDEQIGRELSSLNALNSRTSKQLGLLEGQVVVVQRNLKEFVISYFSDLIIQVKGTDINTFESFFEREVGTKGIVLDTRIQNEFEGQVNALSREISQLQSSLANEVERYNDTVSRYGKQGVNFVVKGSYINNKNILLARDGVVAAGKLVGIDLAKMLKFKPWGAANLAKHINGVLVVVGVALEVWDSWNEHKKLQEYQTAVNEMVSNFEKQREELIKIINNQNFRDSFFPNASVIESSISEINASIKVLEDRRSKLQDWKQSGEAIEAEFSRIS